MRRRHGGHIGLAKQRNERHVKLHEYGKIMRGRHGGRIGLVKQRNGRHIESHLIE